MLSEVNKCSICKHHINDKMQHYETDISNNSDWDFKFTAILFVSTWNNRKWSKDFWVYLDCQWKMKVYWKSDWNFACNNQHT